MLFKLLLRCLLPAGLYQPVALPEKPVAWTYEARRINAQEAVLQFTASLQPGWHIYSAYQKPGGPVKTSFVFEPSKGFSLKGNIAEPKPLVRYSNAFELSVAYFEGQVVFRQRIRLHGKEAVVSGELEYMACNESKCLNPEKLPFHIPVK